MYGRGGQLGWVNLAIQAAAAIIPAVIGASSKNNVVSQSTANRVMSTLQPAESPLVNWDDYLARYPDVAQAYNTPGSKFRQLADASGLHPGEFHYRAGGKAEGRTLTYVIAPNNNPNSQTPTTNNPVATVFGGNNAIMWAGVALAAVVLLSGRR